MSRFDAFSPYDLELLVADILGAEENTTYEVFARGPDGGIDLRRIDPDGGHHVVQVKHYERSSFGALKHAVAAELPKLQRLDPQPATYRLATTRPLSPGAKAQLAASLRPYARGPQDVIGGDELAQRVAARPDVERRHPKLWLSTGTQLSEMINAAVRARSRALVAEIEALLPRYVRHAKFADARRRLHDDHVLVIAGDAGIGKTTLAHILLADALRAGYDEPVQVLQNVEEAWGVFDPARRQVILYDDFLGRTALRRVEKNEDRSLGSFMREVAKVPHTLFILTTREYILRDAQEHHLALAEGQIDDRRFLLRLRQYSLLDRAHIFFNHAYHGGHLTRRARAALVADDAWRRIVEHPNYNPRTVSYITGLAGRRLRSSELADYVTFAESVLDDPGMLWRQAFRDELGHGQRLLLLALAALPEDAEVGDLERAFNGVCEAAGADGGAEAFHEALRTLDDSMLSSHEHDGNIFVTGRDPSVRDYLTAHVAATPRHARLILTGATHWEQVVWIGRHALAGRLDELGDDLVAAAERLFDVRPATFSPVRWFDDDVDTLTRDWVDRSRRINELRVLQDLHRAFAALEGLRGRLLTVHLEGPGEGDITRSSTLSLLRAERDAFLARPAAMAATKAYFTSGLHYAMAWEHLRAFRRLFPALFTDGEWDDLAERCHAWAVSELSNPHELHSSDDADDIAAEAQRMGRPVPDELVSNATEAVSDRPGYRDEPIDDPMPPEGDDSGLPRPLQIERARTLFERLAGDEDDPAATA